jgi:GNAT superfamily N-acetyltransferase
MNDDAGRGLGLRTLSDGTRVELRFIRPDDRAELAAGFARLSPQARYQRFLAVKNDLDDRTLDFLTNVDNENHVAVVAVTESHDLKKEIGLGIGRFIRLTAEPDVAECAVTVADEAQGKGLGRILLHVLAELARERGIRTIRAEVLADNAAIRKLLGEVGAVARSSFGETMVLEVPLEPVPDGSDHHKGHPLRRLLRAAAETLASLHPPDEPGGSEASVRAKSPS